MEKKTHELYLYVFPLKSWFCSIQHFFLLLFVLVLITNGWKMKRNPFKLITMKDCFSFCNQASITHVTWQGNISPLRESLKEMKADTPLLCMRKQHKLESYTHHLCKSLGICSRNKWARVWMGNVSSMGTMRPKLQKKMICSVQCEMNSLVK